MKTFVLIKPDAIARRLVGEIIRRFEQKNLCIMRMETRYKNREWCRQHYHQWDNDMVSRDVLDGLCDMMTNVPLIGIVLAGEEVARVVKAMVGATDSVMAAPGTIRGDFGTRPICNNLVHAADTPTVGKREAAQFFNPATDCWLDEVSPN